MINASYKRLENTLNRLSEPDIISRLRAIFRDDASMNSRTRITQIYGQFVGIGALSLGFERYWDFVSNTETK